MTALLEVERLSVQYGTRDRVVRAVDEVSLSLEQGEILGIVGESGSGKTVTGLAIMGLIDAPGRVAGSVRFNGRELLGRSPAELRQVRGHDIAMVFQDPMTALNPVLTIGTQMTLALRAHTSVSRGAARTRAAEALAAVGIPDARQRIHAYPHQLSGGMRQRVAIAMALLHRPSVIIADEPTTALDVSVQAQILADMRRIAAAFETALIWISHDLAVVSALSDRIAVMYAGRVVEEGATANVLTWPSHPYTRGLLDSLPALSEPGRELAQLSGTAADVSQLGGCAFRNRCPRADATCASVPDWAGSLRQRVRCHHPIASA
jgi:peptide/nickel transport system ATP-binding protein